VLVTLPLSAIIVGAVGWVAKSLIIKQTAMGGVLEGLDPIHIENTFHTFIIVCWETLQHNPWVFGFVIAALTAALMSTIDTLINACAAIFVYDIYKPLIKPEASDKHYLGAARLASVLATVIGVLLVIWFSKQKGSLMSIHYKGIMVIIPSIVTTIFLGAFWKRFTAPAACVSMIAGSVITVLSNGFPEAWVQTVPFLGYFGPQWIDPIAKFVCGPDNGIYIYMRALFGMIATGVIGVAVTFMTQPRKEEDITGLTIGTLDAGMRKYKDGKPNHKPGEKLRRVKVDFDDRLAFKRIALTSAMMKRMKTDEGDMVYVEDSRWYLGGLRSVHTKAGPAHDQGEDLVLMSKETWEDAFFIEGNPVTMEKIF
jgi:SSS family solute:Na+ symporter